MVLQLSNVAAHNGANLMDLVGLTLFVIVNWFALFLFRRLCLFLLDRAALRHSSGNAELW